MLATGEVKCIDEEVPFEIPKGWEWTRVGNIFWVTKLAGFEYTKYFTKDAISSINTVPIVRAQNVRTGRFEENKNETITLTLSKQLERSSLTKKCLLMTFIGAGIGDVCIFPASKRNHLAPNVAKIEPFNNDSFLDYYLIALMSPLGQYGVESIKKSTAQPSLSMETIRHLLIPIPSLAEQRRIAIKWDDLYPLIEKYNGAQIQHDKLNSEIEDSLRKSILQEAIQGKLVPQIAEEGIADKLLAQIKIEKQELVKEGKLKKSALNDSVIFRGDDNKYYEQVGKKCVDITEQIPFEIPNSWTWARMGQIGDWGAGSTPQRGNQDYYGGNILWLKTGELNNGIVYDTEEKITQRAFQDCSLRMNKIGDVLIAMYGATIGKIAIVGKKLTTNQACCGCTPYVVSNWYLFYFLMASRDTFIKKGEGGAQPNISRVKLVEHLIPLPPLREQKRIVQKIEQLTQLLK